MRSNRTKWLGFGVVALMVVLSGCWDEEQEPNDSFADAAVGNAHFEFPTVLKALSGPNYTATSGPIFGGTGLVDCLGDAGDVWIIRHHEVSGVGPGRTVRVKPYTKIYGDHPWANMIGHGRLHVRISTCASQCGDLASFHYLTEAYLDPALGAAQPVVASFDTTSDSQYMVEIEAPAAAQCSAPYALTVDRF